MKYFHYVVTAFLVLLPVKNFSQNLKKETYGFKSLSTGIGICSGQKNDGGLNFYIDLTTEYKKNLFSLSFSTGAEFNLFDASRDYKEFDLLYGREFKLADFFVIEAYTGIGIFNESYKDYSSDFKKMSESTIALPIKIKMLFYVSKNFALGLNPNLTLNKIDNIYSGNLVLQWKL